MSHVDRLNTGCRHKAGFSYKLSRLEPRVSEKMRGIITNNEDLFFSSPILSGENRTSEDVYILFFFDFHYTDIYSKNRTSEDVHTFFLLFQSV